MRLLYVQFNQIKQQHYAERKLNQNLLAVTLDATWFSSNFFKNFIS